MARPVLWGSGVIRTMLFWTTLNVVLAIVFSLLLSLDDRVAHIAGL